MYNIILSQKTENDFDFAPNEQKTPFKQHLVNNKSEMINHLIKILMA